VAGAIAVFVASLAVRAATWSRVLGEAGILPPHGADEFYHLRRIWYSFRHFPETLSHDAYVNHPVGGEIIMAPGFDLVVSALARLLVPTPDQPSVEAVAAWVPAVLGASAAVVVAAIAARVFSPMAGAIGGLLLAFLPGHYHASQIGYVDHHVAVGLEGALLAAAALAVARRPPGSRWVGLAFVLGLGSAAFLLTWPGSLLHIAIFQGMAVIWMLQAREPGVAGSRAAHLALAQALAALALAPYALGRSWSEYGRFSPLVLSSFQPVYFGLTAVASGCFALLWAKAGIGQRRAQRWLAATGLGAFSLGLVLVALPGISSSLRNAAGWFVDEQENYLASISEIQPLFADAGPSGLDATVHLTRLVYLYPLALAWLYVRAARRRRADHYLIAIWGTLLFGLVLSQIRFLHSFTIPYAIVLGAALATLLSAIRHLVARRPRLGAAAAALAIAMLAYALLPSARFAGQRLAVAWQGAESLRPTRRYARALAYHEAAEWLREHSPTTDGYLEPGAQPQYGVLVAWDMGHLVRYVAERPMVQDNFGLYGGRDQFLAGLRYFSTESEAEALRILGKLAVRYVLVDRNSSSLEQRETTNSMTGRLYIPRGGRNVGEGQPPLTLPPLRRHRLIMETPLTSPSHPHVMIYEIVTGATIRGHAPPAEVVKLRLPIRSTKRGAAFSYRAQTVASSDGRYRFVVPYPTGSAPPMATGKRYVLSCSEGRISFTVSENAVAEGTTITLPANACKAR
jgi:dolichyl-diphosphooligosaccharide--protein glycosyltransferase